MLHGRRSRGGEDGFTLVEVMAAIVILLVGVIGVVALADGANGTTAKTKGREAATGITRDVIEGAHAIPYVELTPSTVSATLQAQPGLGDADASAGGWQIKRRNTTFTVTTTLCQIDDPKDGMGAHDATFCSDVGTAGTADASPSDYKRLKIALSWADGGRTGSASQSVLISNTDRGPAVTSLDTAPAGNPVVTSGSSIGFTARTSSEPYRLEWYLDGAYQQDLSGGITGSGTGPFTFSWNIGSACQTGAVMDGSYIVGLQGFNRVNATPGPRSLTVTLNRCIPYTPSTFQAGRNRWGVELRWEANREGDVVGYRVFRGTGSTTPQALASGPCGNVVKEPQCIEPDPSSSTNLTYLIKAIDRDSSGNLREGPTSASVTVNTSNKAPGVPVLSSGGAGATLAWSAVTDQDKDDYVDFYRIYRDGTALSNRYDVIDAKGTSFTWTDPTPGTSSHTYYVTGVDQRLAESNASNGVTR